MLSRPSKSQARWPEIATPHIWSRFYNLKDSIEQLLGGAWWNAETGVKKGRMRK
jgi:hypothetical protein